MRIYTCLPEWEAMLTSIYDAWSCGLGHENIRLCLEPIEQYTLFDEYIHVDGDSDKAQKVISAIRNKISPQVYRELAFASMAYEEDVLDNIYHVLILGFAYGPEILNMVHFKDVFRNNEIRCRVGREANRFREIVRFHQLGNIYIAHIEPKSRVAEYLGPVFQDRMPSEHFMIIDDIHLDAVVHPANEEYYMRKLTPEELEQLKSTEEVNDEFTDLWKVFFDTIAIKERINPRCQMLHFPIWARKHATEFIR